VASRPKRRWHYRAAFVLTGALLLFTLVLLPLTVASVFYDMLGPPAGAQYAISTRSPGAAAPTFTELQIAVIDLSEIQQVVTLRVTGYHVCETPCDWSDRVRFFSIAEEPEEAGFPPSATLLIPPSLEAVTQTVTLPLAGQPLRYPFDDYTLQLGLVLDRALPDGTVQPLPPAEAPSHFIVHVKEQLAQHTMNRPVPLDPQQLQASRVAVPYVYATGLTFHRLLYVRVLSVLLVLLIAAAAAYAVFLRPFQDLVTNSGALIIGIWGIRGVLTPPGMTYVTAVDLSLAVVILFLLSAITVRAVMYLYERSELRAARQSRD
jgi:hypothetical protein